LIRRQLDRIFADSDFGPQPSVLHAAAVCADADGNLCVIRVEATDAPRSEDDRFVLGVARARADAIVTTAANLRAEPRLSHQLHSNPALAAELQKWSGREAARIYVLTASADVSPNHRIFSESPLAQLVTGAESAQVLLAHGFTESQILVRQDTSLRDTVALAQSRPGTKTVLIEAGPSTAATLYPRAGESQEPRLLVDELMLSICEEQVPAQATGPRLFDAETAGRLLANTVRRPAGWSFLRLDRSAIARAF
jgi:riboflavin biosynthesis pyrimidine reductase